MNDDTWMKEAVEHTYNDKNIGGCWVHVPTRCSYVHEGNLLFRRGDGFELQLNEESFRKEMTPT